MLSWGACTAHPPPVYRVSSSLSPRERELRLRPHGAVKGCGDKEGTGGLGLGHGAVPLLHSIGRQRRQDLSLQSLQTGPLKGGKLGEHFDVGQPHLVKSCVEAGIITAQLVAPISCPTRSFHPGLQL